MLNGCDRVPLPVLRQRSTPKDLRVSPQGKSKAAF